MKLRSVSITRAILRACAAYLERTHLWRFLVA